MDADDLVTLVASPSARMDGMDGIGRVSKENSSHNFIRKVNPSSACPIHTLMA